MTRRIVSTYTRASLLAARALSLYGVSVTADPPDTQEAARVVPVDPYATFMVPSRLPPEPRMNRAQRRAAARRR